MIDVVKSKLTLSFVDPHLKESPIAAEEKKYIFAISIHSLMKLPRIIRNWVNVKVEKPHQWIRSPESKSQKSETQCDGICAVLVWESHIDCALQYRQL